MNFVLVWVFWCVIVFLGVVFCGFVVLVLLVKVDMSVCKLIVYFIVCGKMVFEFDSVFLCNGL